MKIGLFFGSFNPVHTGHLIIANYMVESTDLDQVWFVVSPQNPLKKQSNLLDEYDRLHLVQLAIEDNDHLRASNIEFDMPRPSYTIDTLTHLGDKFPKHRFSLIMGSDNLATLPKWKNFEILLRDYFIFVYSRQGEEKPVRFENDHVHILPHTPQILISASFIRGMIQKGQSIRYLVPEKVNTYIDEMHFYK